ncbi:11734_t:CDS:2 [Diversispora eburnea]|uniref:11734_t:CDS:1 n=2 Tax=Diversisporales TaxID=214509 RepID=A0A9N8YW22_9GLOM|nr:11734_t:CDS:2 [Diversispora eburnea]CAG8688731.1 15265_t:CDS:2 [Dentiscutata erythropus]
MSETRRLAVSSSIRPSTIYTSNPLSRDRPISSSRPLSTHSTRPYSSIQDNSKLSFQSSSRPSTIYISANVSQSFKVVRRQRQRKPSRRGTHNVLNQTLDNFYNTLRRTKTYQTVKSAKKWVNEYESYRKSVILEEKEYENYRFSMIIYDDENNSSISPVTKRQSRLSPLSTSTTLGREQQMINRYQNSLSNNQKHKVTEPLYSNYF